MNVHKDESLIQDEKPERPKLLAQDRQLYILNVLVQQGSISVSQIAAELDVSDMTIRRDLVELETEGKLVRIHGGAVLPENSTPVDMDREEPSFSTRLIRNSGAKARIAAVAADIACGYRTVALDVGTTTYLVAEKLVERNRMQIFTNSVRIAHRMGSGAPEIYLAGGYMRGDEMAMGGPIAVAQFEQLWFDVAFIGISGITASGFYDYSFEDVDLKRVYLSRSGYKVVLCDSSKFQRMSLVNIAPLQGVDMLITENSPPPAIALALEAARIKVVIAPLLPGPG
ncbi:DeoR/GlpR family DNA-binding transcription regulator [Acerihabitans sp. TG2]|uniref:DeoR/GlpR family DNA-binding transcription regulator n=1 Tax=Acerihabitans sp. TG2 TaxID=3096008 RepID=UPI002B225DC1|nr:DeoR/GlpR family DNA-binding transcription regulator [Acerihabitans sp. TG2]MEA9391477.1 DeoR/GlpR family DNA-binding transcription regulator [Acerihabitans sp. TG2]